jgi:hypothetical protein
MRIASIPSIPSFGGGVASIANPLAANRSLLLRAVSYNGAGTIYDESGNGNNAQAGSTTGADANDPTWVYQSDHLRGLYHPGLINNSASSPANAAVRITGALDLRWYGWLSDWTPGARMALLARYTTTGNQRCYAMTIATSGRPELFYSQDGTVGLSAVAPEMPVIADRAAMGVRVTRDPTTGEIQFYTSPDFVTWTALGAAGVGTTGDLFDSATAPVEIGIHTLTTLPLNGVTYRAQIYNGIGGTLAYDADFTDPAVFTSPFASFAEKSASAATVTINRAASGKRASAVDRPLLIFGSDDYLEVADNANLDFAAADPFTLCLLFRMPGIPTGTQVVTAKAAALAAASAGWAVYLTGDGKLNFRIKDGSFAPTITTAAALTPGVLYRAAFVRDVAGDRIYIVLNNVRETPVTDTTTGSLANAEALRVGRFSGAGTNYADMSWAGVSLHRAVLSDANADLQCWELG